MNRIFIMKETIIQAFSSSTLSIITLLAILSAVYVIITRNPIVSVLFLIGLFITISVHLMMLGLNFIGLSYLLVYVGAVSILFLFILMLINVRISEIVSTTRNSIMLAIFIGSLFLSSLNEILPSKTPPTSNSYYATRKYTDYINNYNLDIIIAYYLLIFWDFLVRSLRIIYAEIFDNNYENLIVNVINKTSQGITFTNWDNMLTFFSHIIALGSILFTSYPMWILLTSLVLLLSMVGTIVITMKN